MALAVGVVLVLAVGAYHLRCMSRLVAWTLEPVGTPVPRALGAWDYVLSNLNRRTRVAYDQKERLVQTLSRFREASNAMPYGVIYLSRHNVVEWLNNGAAAIFGLDEARDIGKSITNIIRQPDFVEYLEAGDHQEALTLHSMRQEGLTLSVQVVPFGAEQRMVLARDITQYERLENMRREFVANVSHELKTPLTVVSGFVEMLLDEEEFSAEDTHHYLGMVLEQSMRMQRLVEDLLTLSTLQAAGPMLADEKVDAQALIAAVFRETQVLSGGRHTVELQQGPPVWLLGSQKELHSAFANLASNAVRYTPDGGAVRIAWAITPDGGAAFSVSDTGIGIAAEHIPRLTERFYRVDRGRSRETGGTGLGLAIVKHILTRHQAHLEIDSEPGRGSRFTVHFPAKRIVPRARS